MDWRRPIRCLLPPPGKTRRKLRSAVLAAVGIIAAAGCFTLYANIVVERCGERVSTDVDKIEAREVGLLLGTKPHGKYGPNLYFRYRIEAAAELYHAGKIRRIIVSGDNSRKDYNEPEAMRRALEARGVKPEDIYEDYAGFRTLDSVIRADKVFGQKRFTVISQMFHCKRALYLAERNGIDAIGFAAQDVRIPRFRLKNHLRETLSRSAAVLDILLGRGPHFLGDPIRIDVQDKVSYN